MRKKFAVLAHKCVLNLCAHETQRRTMLSYNSNNLQTYQNKICKTITKTFAIGILRTFWGGRKYLSVYCCIRFTTQNSIAFRLSEILTQTCTLHMRKNETEKIEHLHSSIKFVRVRTVKVSSMPKWHIHVQNTRMGEIYYETTTKYRSHGFSHSLIVCEAAVLYTIQQVYVNTAAQCTHNTRRWVNENKNIK